MRKETIAIYLIIAVAILPIIGYFFIIEKYALNIPWSDDFIFFLEPILNDSNVLAEIFRLHGNYRLVFQKLVAYLFYSGAGEFNFKHIIYFGNVVLVLIALIFTKVINKKKLIAIIPVFFLLFNFKYFESTFWALTATVAHWTALWALLTFYLLNEFIKEKEVKYFVLAIGTAFLTTFSFGNGFLVLFVSLFILYKKRQFLIIWVIVSLLFVVFYFYGFQAGGNTSTLDVIFSYPIDVFKTFFTLLGTLLFIGPFGLHLSLIVGVAISLYFVYLSFNAKYFNLNPAIYCMMLFLFLTAFFIGLGRTNPEATIPYTLLTSRYSFWMTLLMICIYISIIDILKPKFRTRFIWIGIISSLFYLIYSYSSNIGFIKSHHENLISGIAEYKIDNSTGLLRTIGTNEMINPIMQESIRKEIYTIPEIDYAKIESHQLNPDQFKSFDDDIISIKKIDFGYVEDYIAIRGFFGKTDLKENNIFIQLTSQNINSTKKVYFSTRTVANHKFSDHLDMVSIIPLKKLTEKKYVIEFVYITEKNELKKTQTLTNIDILKL